MKYNLVINLLDYSSQQKLYPDMNCEVNIEITTNK